MNRYHEFTLAILSNGIGRHDIFAVAGLVNIGRMSCNQEVTVLVIATGCTHDIDKCLVDLVACLIYFL